MPAISPAANPYDAIVIGAGGNGLVAAAVLAGAGRRVVVVERADCVGGQARTLEIGGRAGFRSPIRDDAGWVPPAVAEAVGASVDGPSLVRPATSVSVVGDDGLLAVPCDVGQAVERIKKYSPRDAARWPELVTRIAKLARFLGELYRVPPPDVGAASLRDLASLVGLGRRFRALGRDDMAELLRVLPISIQDFLDDELESPTLKAAIGAGGMRDIRQGPRSGGTTFVFLHYLVGAPPGSVRSRPWWQAGPDAFVAAADAAARRAGATIRVNAEVARIMVREDAVTGVALAGGEEIAAPLVVSTTDPGHTLLGLVDPVWLDAELIHDVKNIKYRGCSAVVLYALDGLPVASSGGGGLGRDELASVVSLTPSLDRLERAYDAAKYGTVSPDPHVEITVPSLRWPSLAPNGHHVLLARVQYVPYRAKAGDWTPARAAQLADVVTGAIGRALPGFSDRVLERRVLSPRDLEETFGVTGGALTHGEITLDQILFMRPIAGFGRYAMPVDGLYLGGAGAHPGPGVLGGAGLLAARAALEAEPTRNR